MGKIQRYGAQRWASEKRQASLPPWGQAVGLVVLVVLFIWIGFVLIFPSKPTTFVTPPTAVNTIAPTTLVSPTTQVGIVNSGGTTVASAGGGTVQVSTSALTLAKEAARSFYTGNWAGVSEAPGFVQPAKQGTTPTIVSFDEAGSGSEQLSFNFVISPGDGQINQTLHVFLVTANGTTWAVSYLWAS
jgi:hypothetical protein